MALQHNTVTVGTTATDLTADVPDTRNFEKRSILIQNSTGVTLYLGGPGVTATDYGYALVDGADFALDLGDDEALFAVVASGTEQVRLLHAGV